MTIGSDFDLMAATFLEDGIVPDIPLELLEACFYLGAYSAIQAIKRDPINIETYQEDILAHRERMQMEAEKDAT